MRSANNLRFREVALQSKALTMTKLPDPIEFRKPEYPIEQMFVRRWSPRAMTGQSMDRETLMSLFEAARWAPSTYNEQEWRFVFALRETTHWDTFFGFLAEANQAWCKNAAVLVVVFSHKFFQKNGNPNPVHTFDAGAAFQNLALQGSVMDLVVHGMAGFDQQSVRAQLEIPDSVAVEAMIAIGFRAEVETLPAELQEKEVPSGRKRVCEIVAEGKFNFECNAQLAPLAPKRWRQVDGRRAHFSPSFFPGSVKDQ